MIHSFDFSGDFSFGFAGKKVLITGGLGFIGSNVASLCVKAGAAVTLYDCLYPHSGANYYNIDSFRSSVEIRINDILDFDRLSEAVAGQDLIINCAASTSHVLSMSEPWLNQEVNDRGMINLLEAIRRFNPDARLIHLGTTTQLGPLQYQPADEKHPEFPADIYSANKSVSEKYTLIYARAHDLRTTVLRFPNVYGPRANIQSPEFTFNNFFIGLALQNEAITVYGEGGQMRNVLHVDDVAAAILQASQMDSMIGQVYFVVSDEHYSVKEIAELTVRNIGSGRVVSVPWPEGKQKIDMGDAIISNKKFTSACGWQPQITIEQGLQQTAEYFRPCLQKYLELE